MEGDEVVRKYMDVIPAEADTDGCAVVRQNWLSFTGRGCYLGQGELGTVSKARLFQE